MDKKPAKVKELTQPELRALARDILESTRSGDHWEGVLGRFGLLPAAGRKSTLEALRAEAGDQPPQADGDRVLQLGLAACRPGKSSKSGFMASLVLLTLETMHRFDCDGRSAHAELLEALILRDSTKAELPALETEEFSRLSPTEAVTSALSSFLASKPQDVLAACLDRWAQLVVNAISCRGAKSGLEPDSAKAVLRVMADPLVNIPPGLALCASWLCQLAGGVPPELELRSPFRDLTAGAIVSRANAGATVDPTPGPRAQLLAGIDSLLAGFEREFDQRRANLVGELARVRGELAALTTRLEETEASVREQVSRKNSLETQLKQLSGEAEAAVGREAALRQEVDNWRKEAEALRLSREHQIEDTRAEAKREFARSARSNLVSLRNFLLDLRANDSSKSAQLAGAAYDEIIRTLHKQRFIGAEELPRMNTPDQEGTGEGRY